jgi:hypothetical protein
METSYLIYEKKLGDSETKYSHSGPPAPSHTNCLLNVAVETHHNIVVGSWGHVGSIRSASTQSTSAEAN